MANNKLLQSIVAAILITTPLSAFCADDDDQAFGNKEIYWLNQWDIDCYESGKNNCREQWYGTPEGSHMVLYEVFRALETPESEELFASRHSLAKYGFLFPGSFRDRDDDDYLDPVEPYLSVDDLPLGVLKDTNRLNNVNYVGFTCAACHTGKMTYGDDHYYIEAGQGMVDLNGFFADLLQALQANSEGKKLKRFKKRFKDLARSSYGMIFGPVSPLAGEFYLAQALENFNGFMERNVPVVENGPGRLDAIGTIFNEVLIHQSGLDDNGEAQTKPLTAPVSYPYIWDAPDLSCIQTNCVSADPLTRNAAQALGTFGNINLDDDENILDIVELIANRIGLNNLFETTTKVDNLFSLEVSLGKINSPRWPESFPPLDPELVDQGKVLYTRNCAGCHVDVSDGVDDSELSEPNALGFRFTRVLRVPFTEVGTDPSFIQDYAFRSEPTGILGALLALQAPEQIDPATGIPFGEQPPTVLNALILLGTTSAIVEKRHFDSPEFKALAEARFPDLSSEEALNALKIEYTNGQIQPRGVNPFVYRAKPLNGIAFTGPFLHNGSVRTLADLLKRPQDRPTAFNVGATEFDPVNVGYIDGGDFVFDTTVRGNGNQGHDYGTALSDSEKSALLEYLKSI